MYAVIEAGGKQYKVQKNDIVFTEKLEIEEGKSTEFKVIAISDGKKFTLGSPYIKSAKVSGEVLKNNKKRKITVFTYKAKKNQKRKLGHRQPYTKIKINSISI